MESFRQFWQSWGPWISIALVPTIIAGLSVSPKTKEAAGFMTKAWNAFKSLLGVLSIATFKDQPGTFQLPLKLGKLTKKTPPTTALIVGLWLSLLSCGCCAWTHSCREDNHGGQAVTSAIDCTIAAVRSQMNHFAPTVMAILKGGAPDWQAQLDSLKKTGSDALACAIQQASMELLAMSTPPPGENAGASPEVLKARAEAAEAKKKATSYIATNKFTFKKTAAAPENTP